MFKKILILLCLIFSTTTFAWNSNGHRIIAEIAYANLTPQAKKQIDKLTQQFDPGYNGRSRFLYAAIWPDKIKFDGVNAFDSWHFIDKGFSTDGTPIPSNQTENVVWAIGQSEHTILSPTANNVEKATALSFLIHFVGDAHQPMHCTERYSKQFPAGDKNGLLFPISDTNANNLHNYWDGGLGLFPIVASPMPGKIIGQIARQFQQDYPEQKFGATTANLNAQAWANESFQMGKNFAYTNIQENSKPSVQYIAKGRDIAESQIALAGYRLANLLNKLFS